VKAIPFRKMISLRSPALQPVQRRNMHMGKAKRSGPGREFALVHPNAAAIDIGATMHMAAVGPNCDPEPVRSFGTFTGDLHRCKSFDLI
jgi:hypothetical protein